MKNKIIFVAVIILCVIFISVSFGRKINSPKSITPVPTSSTTTAPTTTAPVVLPKFNSNSGICSEYKYGELKNKDGNTISWQTSMQGSGKRYSGDIIQIGMRNKYGSKDDYFWSQIRVETLDGNATSTNTGVQADNWSYVLYPKDFPGAGKTVPGTYTVIYQTQGNIIACSGFIIE